MTPKNEKDLQSLLQQEAKQALVQIEQNAYTSELKQRGINDIVKIGLAFSGKGFHVEAERENTGL